MISPKIGEGIVNKERINAESTSRKHAEEVALESRGKTDLLLLFVQNAAPCEDCEAIFLKLSKNKVTGKKGKETTTYGISFMVKIVGDHGGYVAEANTLFFHNGVRSIARPEGFPPYPAALPD